MLAVGWPTVSIRVGIEVETTTSIWNRGWFAQIPSRLDFDALAWHPFRFALFQIYPVPSSITPHDTDSSCCRRHVDCIASRRHYKHYTFKALPPALRLSHYSASDNILDKPPKVKRFKLIHKASVPILPHSTQPLSSHTRHRRTRHHTVRSPAPGPNTQLSQGPSFHSDSTAAAEAAGPLSRIPSRRGCTDSCNTAVVGHLTVVTSHYQCVADQPSHTPIVHPVSIHWRLGI